MRPLQSLKALLPITRNVSGSESEVSVVQPVKAKSLILVSPWGTMTMPLGLVIGAGEGFSI